jgi:hypothetical protein
VIAKLPLAAPRRLPSNYPKAFSMFPKMMILRSTPAIEDITADLSIETLNRIVS